jgi:hypothetical protein
MIPGNNVMPCETGEALKVQIRRVDWLDCFQSPSMISSRLQDGNKDARNASVDTGQSEIIAFGCFYCSVMNCVRNHGEGTVKRQFHVGLAATFVWSVSVGGKAANW